MNKYKLQITSQDYYGHNFIDNIIKYAKKGAVLDKKERFYNDYPHACVMVIETEEFLKSEPSVDVVVVREEYTKEALEAMDWDELRAMVKSTKGITGRDRDQLIRKFLEANEQQVA
jgi:hypothetical protein